MILIIYRSVFGILAVGGLVTIWKSKKWGLFVLGLSLFIQRYNLYFPEINRSLQLSFIFIPVLLWRWVIWDMTEWISAADIVKLNEREVIKPNSLVNVRRMVECFLGWIGIVWNRLWQETFFKWLVILWGSSAITFLWAYDKRQAVIELVLRGLTFGTAFVVYWIGKKDRDSLWYLFGGVIVWLMMDIVLSVFQMRDCILFGCNHFMHFEHKILGIKGLRLTAQTIKIDGFGRIFRFIGMLGDVNMHGFVVLSVNLLIFGLVGLKHKSYVYYLVLYFLLFCSLCLGLGSLSRSAIVGWLLVIGYWLFRYCIRCFVSNIRIVDKFIFLCKVFFTVVCFSLPFFVIYIKESTVNKFVDSFVEARFNLITEHSAIRHFKVLGEALEIGVCDVDFRGVGVGSYSSYYLDMYDSNVVDRGPHSWIGRLFVEEGMISICVYISFFVWYLFGVWKNPNQINLPITVIPLMFISGMMVYYGFFLPMTWVWFGVAEVYLR